MSLNPSAVSNVDTYFAAQPYYSDQIGNELQAKVDDYYSWLTSSSLVQLWRRAFYCYYGLATSGSGSGFGMFAIGTIIPGGVEGELAKLKVNHFANLINHLHVLTTQSRPALESRAINSDSASLSAAYLADGIIEYFFRENGMEERYREAVLIALILGEAFIRMDWDARAGRQYSTSEHGAPIMDGDVTSKVYNPFDCVRDVSMNSARDAGWWITRDAVNRYDLIARYPHLRDEILNASRSDNSTQSSRRFMDPTKVIPEMGSNVSSPDSVLIDQFEFLHEPTPACPNGRYSVFLQGGLVLFDGPLPFDHVPVHRISAGEVLGCPFGWTLGFDLLGIQEAVDKLYSVSLSNQMASGVQNFWQPPNNGLTKTSISGGLNLLESIVKPEVLEMCATPAEVFAQIQRLEAIMETLSGVSSVSRGQTPENLKSGSALAFVNATSLSFSSGLQNSANRLLEDMGNSLVSILRDYASTPRIATIAGSSNVPLMKSYTGNDLNAVNRVTVEATAAVSKTTAGKIQIAQDMLNAGLIKTPQEYLTVITTGKLEPLYEGEMAEILLVRSENEALRNGEMVKALRIDEHAFHIAEHKSLLSNPAARRDPNLVDMVLAHIEEHEGLQQMLQAQDPAYLAATKQPPLPFPVPPQPQLPAPTPIRAGPQGLPQSQAAVNNAGAVTNTAQPKLPSLPQGAGPQAQEANAQFAGKAAR